MSETPSIHQRAATSVGRSGGSAHSYRQPLERAAGILPAGRALGPADKMSAARWFKVREQVQKEQGAFMNLCSVGQAFLPAGSPGFPARRTNWGLESLQNRQPGKTALRIHGHNERFANCRDFP